MPDYLKYVIVLVLFCANGSLIAASLNPQDTIPPVFTAPPQNITVTCDADINNELTFWLDNHAMAEADQGEAEIINLISNNDALILLEEVRSASCSGTGDLEIGFVAQDSCNNLSTDTLFAIFTITDNIPPEFIMSSKDVGYNCHYGIKDSLQYWIDKIGFAEIADNCSDTIIRTNYSWKDNLGNTGFSDFEGPTNIVISREVCLWSVDVSFFIEDECGNINVSSATFRINGDSHSPDIVNAPRDTIIQCSENIPDSHIIFMDGCDGDLEFEFTETNTRATDELECAYYNYDITRHWNARDACGNEEVFTQFISVRDTSGPEAIYQGVLALDCDSDITDLSDFINITDNCRMDTIFYSDSIISSSRCNTEILRNYIARDICQNETGFEQTLQLQDFSAPGFMTLPKDTIVECSEDVINIFNTWIDSFGFAIVNDNCNQFYTKALNPGLYTDTILINNSITPGYSIPECSQQAEDGILGFQIVEFVVYDECGNINMNRASFTVVDTVAPDIQFCPADLDIDLFDTQCDTSLLIRLPGIDDNCFPGKTDNYQVQINSDTPIIPLQDSIFLNFPAGRNKVQYHYRDCGGNTDSCTQIIQINDLEAPILTCPDDITIILEEQNCNAEYILSSLQDFFENCASPVDFSIVKPEGEGLLSFYLNNSTKKYSARNSILTFSEIQSEGLIADVRLILDYSMNLSPGSQVELRSESGNLLHQISTSNCNEEEVIIKIAQDQFDFWSNDGRINFAIVHLTGSGEGTIPCASENLSGQVTNDGVSYFRISVEYSDIKPEVTIKNLGTDELIPLGQDVVSLEPGSYIAEYSEEDAFGNTGMCFQKIEVIDEKIPQITCKDVVIETPVQASPFYNLITANHIQSVSDNCAIETVELSEDRFSCSEIGTSFEIQLEATDIYGNSSTCNSIVTAKSVPLNPNYLSSLCLADSLQLFANLDPAFVQSYIWTGPDNFRSQEADPIIHNINNSNSGTYFLAVTTRNGCTFFGSLDITIDEFYNPVIASDTTDYCLNEDVFLSASIFTEQVNYLWYEGIPPAGNLVNETTDPVLVLNPSPGKHFYYVEIMSEICNSNPSPVIAIDVLPQPAAEVDHVFITICEGEDIILSTSIFSSILNYEWTGPNGYFSRDRLPAVIEDTDLSDGGVYTLTIDNGICSSDPAYTQVTIFEQPPRPEITSNGVFCEGQNAVLDVLNTPTGIRYHWFKNGQLFNSTSSNSLLLTGISGIDTGAYTVVVEDGICFSDTSKVHFVSIEDRIPIGATNNGPVCEGEEILLSSTFIPGALYLWEDPAGQLFSGREISVSASQGTYKLTVTSENNCLAETTTEVIVDVRPEITALSNTSLNCMSSDMDISFFPTVFPVGDYIYEWSGPGMFDSNLENPVITMLDSLINGTYTLQVIKENCASSPATTEVEITIKPEIPEIQLSNHPCIGDTFEIVIQNPVSGQMVEWLWTTPLGLVTTFEPFLKINGFNNNFAGNYTVIQSFNDCRSEKSESIFLENPVIPEKPNINGLGIICEGDNLIFFTETVNGASYVWNTPKGPIITSAPNLEIQNINTTDEGTYSLYIELGSCISPSSDIINLSVLTKPAPPSFPIDTLGFCINEVESIDICLESYPVTGDVNYILINRLNGQVILEQDSPCFDLSFLNTGVQKEYTLTAVIELNDCQSDLSNDILLEFNEIPSQGAITELPSYIVCGETSVSININNPQSYPVNYSSPNADLVISEIEPFEILVSNLNIGLNQIILSSSFKQCIDFYNDTTELIVLDKPVANDDDFTIQYSQAIVLDILQNDQISYPIALIEFSNLNHGNISFTDGQVQYIPVPGISENIEFDYTICYESCQDECDDAHVTISIEGNEDCRIGNIITPNRDGYNDYFTIECLENNAYPDNRLNIYNQWGDVIFSASPYNNDWDGRFNGESLPAGSYFYVLNLGENQGIFQGFIIIEF